MDRELRTKVLRIKRKKPSQPASRNCIDFELGDSGYGVRVIITWDSRGSQWLVSTSIGTLNTDGTPGLYVPIFTHEWSESLRKAATDCIDEVLQHFAIREDSKRAEKGRTAVMFKFRELDG